MEQLIYPDAHDWIGAMQAGQQAGMTQRRTVASQQAGGLMASGDYKGAAAAMYGAGDIASGSAIAQAGYTQKTEADKLARQQAVQAKVQANDLPGAYAAAGTDPDLLNALDKVSAHAKDTLSQTAAALQSLKGPDGNWLPPDQARTKYAALKPALVARGLPAAQLDAFDPTPENLAAMQAQVLGLDKQLEMSKGVAVGPDLVNPYSGKEMHKGDEYKTVGPGQTLIKVGGDPGSAPTAGAGPGAPITAPMTTPMTQPTATAGAGQPRGLRNNNPLNVTVLPHGQWDGQTGADGQYATFATPEAGLAAADKNLQAYATHHGINTLAGIITRWSPPSENDTKGYIATVSKDLGVDPAQPLNMADPTVRSAILHSMAKVELGQSIPAASARPAPSPMPQPPAAAPQMPGGAQVVYSGGPEWVSDGKGNLVNRATGDRKVDPTASADAVANPDLVKAILEGRAPVPTANRAATDPKWQAAMAAAMAQDPTLDAANYGTRVKTRADFATGTAAKTKTALNTALGHAGDLDSQVDGLHNVGFRPLNMVDNYVANQTGDPKIKTFDLTKEALMHEAMKVFSGSAGSMMEFNQLASTLDVNDSPAQQHSVIKKLVGLLASKMDALAEQYKTGMGKELDQSAIMSPHAQDVFSKISGLAPGTRPATGGAPSPAAAGSIIRYDAQGHRIQ
jgi:hypothetical protein